jgi:hypothetical protein
MPLIHGAVCPADAGVQYARCVKAERAGRGRCLYSLLHECNIDEYRLE